MGDVANVKGGKRLPRGVNLTTEANKHPYIRVRDLGSKKTLELDSSYEYVDDETQKKIARYIVNEGDIIISIVGTIGLVAIIGSSLDNANLTENCVKLIDLKGIDKEFLYYYLISDKGKNEIEKGVVGAVQAKLPIKNIQAIKIKAPVINDQKRIASILSTIDSKIECNRRINENLEQQAQALFKSWFVDFEPFKDQPFVESELGMIPQGWRVARIKDIPHTLNTGKRPKGGAIASGVPSIGAEQLKGLCNYDYTKTKYISKEYSQSIPKGKVVGFEVYLNRVGGKPGDYIQNTTMFGEGYPYENCYINDHVFKLDFMQNRGYNVYIYFTFLTSRIKKYLNACGGKAAIPVINKQNIDDIYVFLPENEYVIKFGESVLPIMNIIFKNGLESARLAELRDTLLPKLMSGELKVENVTF